jgi:hypothetical protein
MVFDAAALRLELVEHLPEHPGAPAALRQAIDTFVGLRAAPWVKRGRAAETAASSQTLR